MAWRLHQPLSPCRTHAFRSNSVAMEIQISKREYDESIPTLPSSRQPPLSFYLVRAVAAATCVSRLSRQRQNDPVRALRSATVTLGHGSLHRKPRVGGRVVHFVTGPMVGDRRFPGAKILGARLSTFSANHSLSVPPTGSELRDVSWTVYEMVNIKTCAMSWRMFFFVRRCGVFVASCCGSDGPIFPAFKHGRSNSSLSRRRGVAMSSFQFCKTGVLAAQRTGKS